MTKWSVYIQFGWHKTSSVSNISFTQYTKCHMLLTLSGALLEPGFIHFTVTDYQWPLNRRRVEGIRLRPHASIKTTVPRESSAWVFLSRGYLRCRSFRSILSLSGSVAIPEQENTKTEEFPGDNV